MSDVLFTAHLEDFIEGGVVVDKRLGYTWDSYVL